MKNNNDNYFLYSLSILIIATGTFFIFKTYLPDKLFIEPKTTIAGLVIDSLALDAIASPSIVMSDNQIVEDTTIATTQINLKSSVYTQGYDNLIRFYQKLYRLETQNQGKVRIAYFSDSMTDGDLIVQDLRNAYQNRFGGKGVGFVGVTSLSASSRASISHQFSSNWFNQSFLSVKNPKRLFGIDGQVALSSNGWVKFKASAYINLDELDNPSLFYGRSSNSRGSAVIQADTTRYNYVLKPDNLLNVLRINGSYKNLNIQFNQADSIPFYGFNFDDGKGVHIDNFSIRGNSGLPLSLFNQELMNQFDRVLNYDLIILHYGTNVLNYGTTDYKWYNERMRNVVNHLKKCFPNADVVVISVADRAIKYDASFSTDKAVEPLLKSQREYAYQTGSAFIDLYMLMGGSGSMVDWVNQKPPLANKDYTHFSSRGAKKIATLIYAELENGYNEYKIFNKKQ